MAMEPIIFRKASEGDLPAIVALLADDALGQGREDPRLPLAPAYVAAFRAIESDTNQLLAVAANGDAVVGTMQVSFIPGVSRGGAWRGQIEAVRVADSHRSSGLGRRMIEWAIDQCRARGCTMIQLTTDKARADAHRFYERLGFRASHEGYKLPL